MIPRPGTMINTIRHLLEQNGRITDDVASCLYHGQPNEQRGFCEKFPNDAINIFKYVYRMKDLKVEEVYEDASDAFEVTPEMRKDLEDKVIYDDKENVSGPIGLRELKEAKRIGEVMRAESVDIALSPEESTDEEA